MKKLFAILLTIATVFTSMFSLTGCSEERVHIFTRAEWIKSVASVFNLEGSYSKEPYFDDVKKGDDCFDAVQSCAEWEIIDKGGEFNPKDRADVNFAIVTAVKSIGLDKIAKSVDGKELKNEDEIIEYFNDNSETKYVSGSNLYMDTAAEILADINRIYNDMVLEQYQKVEYAENVITVKESNVDFSMDGETAIVNGIDAKIGTILILEPTTNYPYGKYAKITAKNGNQIKYVQPEIGEMFEQLTISGTYDIKPMGFIPANDGVKVKSIGGNDVVPQSSYYGKNGELVETTIYVPNATNAECDALPLADGINLGDIELELSNKIGGVEISGELSLKDITATADIDMWGPILKKAEVKIDTSVEVSAGLKGKLEKTIPLGKIPFTLWGAVGIDVDLGIKIGVEGSVSLVVSFDATAGVNYKPLSKPKYTAQATNPNFDLEVKAKAYIKPEIKGTFVIAGAPIANVGIYGGVEASASFKHGTSEDSNCIDINAYMPLAFYIGAEDKETLLGTFGIKYKIDIWDKNSSPVKKNFHVEDFEIVPECTKKDKDNEDTETTEDAFENIPTIDDVVNSILQSKSGLMISTYYASLEENESDKLVVTGLPSGYTMSNLKFSSSNPSVATVNSSGTVTAVSSGNTIIKVETSDGLYSQYCAIYVLASYDVDFTPLNYVLEDCFYAVA